MNAELQQIKNQIKKGVIKEIETGLLRQKVNLEKRLKKLRKDEKKIKLKAKYEEIDN